MDKTEKKRKVIFSRKHRNSQIIALLNMDLGGWVKDLEKIIEVLEMDSSSRDLQTYFCL